MGRAAGSVEVHPVAAQPEPALLAVRARAHREARFPLRRRRRGARRVRVGPLLLRLLVVVRLMLVWWLLVLVLRVLRVWMRRVERRRGLDVDRGRRGLAVAVAMATALAARDIEPHAAMASLVVVREAADMVMARARRRHAKHVSRGPADVVVVVVMAGAVGHGLQRHGVVELQGVRRDGAGEARRRG